LVLLVVLAAAFMAVVFRQQPTINIPNATTNNNNNAGDTTAAATTTHDSSATRDAYPSLDTATLELESAENDPENPPASRSSSSSSSTRTTILSQGEDEDETEIERQQQGEEDEAKSGRGEVVSESSTTKSMLRQNPLGIPEGQAQALPSIRLESENDVVENTDKTAVEVKRGIYGGKGDKKHLGGFTQYDGQGVSPKAWNFLLDYVGVKSIMDVGCGKGVSTLWFHLHGAKVLCLEGSHDAVSQTLLPDPATQVVEHDMSRGPYWPKGVCLVYVP